MLTVPAELAAAITAPLRQPRVRLSVDFDADGHGPPDSVDDLTNMVTAYRLERSLDGELPEQVRLVTGAGAAAARVTLARAGVDGRSAAWYFSPLNPASPLATKTRVGRPARLHIEFATAAGPRSVPRLTGWTRALSADAARADATLAVLDAREQLRGLVALPPIDGGRYGANATWIISWALAVCGWTPAPLPRAMRRLGAVADAAWISDAAICLPMHGSLWPWFRGLSHGGGLPPNVGAFTASGAAETASRPAFVPGPFLLGAHAAATAANRYTAIRATMPVSEGAPGVFETAARTGRVEMWVRGDAYPATPPSDEAVSVRSAGMSDTTLAFSVGVWRDRRLFARLVAGTTTRFQVFGPALPADAAWHFVGIAFQLSGTTPQVVFRLDNTSTTANVTLGGNASLTDVFTIAAFLPVADLQLTGTPLTTTWLNQAVSGSINCDIDPSTLELDAVVEREQREAWELVREIAAAEQAVVLCDEIGRFSYRTRARTGPAAPVLTLTAADAVTDLAVTESLDTVRTVVEVPYTAPILATGYAWALDQPLHLPAGATVTLPVILDAPAIQLDLTFDLVTAAPATAVSYLRAYANAAGTGTAITASVSAYGHGFTTTGQGRVTFSNGNTTAVYVTEARLAGRIIRTRPTGVAVAEHPRLAGTGEQPQPLRLPDSQWVQRHDIAAALAEAILPDVAEPQPTITDLTIRADPRIQLGDRVRLIDRDGVGVDGHWWITGITESHEPTTGYTMRLTARQATGT